ncbi:MAG: hypothetical protein HC852_04085 [Acaryochloridaceae cyanobacterium RU_4_10]|nr:hypothetical protein [Acaryochloridaceae cyanobacterium RU_4_10]
MNVTDWLMSQGQRIPAGLGAIATAFLLTACGPQQQQISCESPAPKAAAANLNPSSDIQLSVLIDGTPSMQGYVNGLSDSRYNKTLQLIDSASSTGWNRAGTSVKYYRFGTQKQPIDRETYLRAQLPAFYQGGANFSVSRIDAALSEPSPDGLSVIVTDLYQKDADVRLVQNQLAQRFLEKGQAIGVLGVKSEFKGSIYDVGLTGQSFTYSTASKSSQSFHPFYVILLGSYGNVNRFFEQLKRNGLSDVEHQFEIFYPQPIQQPAMLDPNGIKGNSRKDLIQPKALNDGQVVVRKQNAQDPVQFFVMSSKTQATPLPVEIPYKPLDNVLPLDPTAIAVKATAEQYQKKSKNFQPINAQGIQLTDWKVAPQSIQFQSKFQADALEKGIYRFTFDASPSDLAEPAWWAKWNASEGSLSGDKTNNLLPFLRGLRLSTVELMKQQNPVIARLCYAIQKK